jgi:predicted dehydrogenase
VKAGKHVLVEKPGGISSTQLAEIESAAAAVGALVRIGYNHRFHPGFRKAYELVEREDLGEVMFIRGRYGHGGRVGYDREWRMDAAQGRGWRIDRPRRGASSKREKLYCSVLYAMLTRQLVTDWSGR